MRRPAPLVLAAVLSATVLPAPRADAAPPAAPPAPAATAGLLVRSADGTKSFRFVEKGDVLEVTLPGGDTLVGTPSGEKRKYRRASNGQQVCEVKAGDDGFKLRANDGALYWKVKLGDDKIKVSDNEENRNPWSLKTKYDDKVKVVDASENVVAEVRFHPDKVKVKGPSGADLWECRAARRSAAFGVLAIEKIPEGHRAILAAEILKRGR